MDFLEKLEKALEADRLGIEVSKDGSSAFDALVADALKSEAVLEQFRTFVETQEFYSLVAANPQYSVALRQGVRTLNLLEYVQKSEIRKLLRGSTNDTEVRSNLLFWLRDLNATPAFTSLAKEVDLRKSDPCTWITLVSTQLTPAKLELEVEKLANESHLDAAKFLSLVPFLRNQIGDGFAKVAVNILNQYGADDGVNLASKIDTHYGYGLTEQLKAKSRSRKSSRQEGRSILETVKTERDVRRQQLQLADA